MKFVKTIRQALWGLQHIQSGIIARARARRVTITATNFSWNRGVSLGSELPPELIAMGVRVGSRHVSSHWPRAHLEDHGDRIERSEVRQEIERIVEQLAPRQMSLVKIHPLRAVASVSAASKRLPGPRLGAGRSSALSLGIP